MLCTFPPTGGSSLSSSTEELSESDVTAELAECKLLSPCSFNLFDLNVTLLSIINFAVGQLIVSNTTPVNPLQSHSSGEFCSK